MSAAPQGIDARGYLSGWLVGLTDMYQKDLRALPADQWQTTHGGVSRSAQDLTADAIALLVWVTNALNGDVSDTYGMENVEGLRSELPTAEAACAKLGEACSAFGAALSAASDEDLNKMVTPPWKMDAPLYLLAQIAVSHVWYHDGQLNYIQTLLGDGEVHWMG